MTHGSEITVVALLDAFRHDYLSPDAAPFLSSRSDTGVAGAVEEPFGYQTRPAFFAGLYPETSGICTMFERRQGSSPFEIARFVPTAFDNRKYVDWGLRRLLERYVRWRSEHRGVRAYATPADIPFCLLHEFDLAEKQLPWEPGYLSQSTVFDVLREYERQWHYEGWPFVTDYTSDDRLAESCVESVTADHSYLYVHLSELDGLGHAHGPATGEVRAGIRRADDRLRRIWSYCEEKFDAVNLIAFGDHGMVDVTEAIDLWTRLQETDHVLGDDYLAFLDSTMARFWFEDDRARETITSILQDIEAGTILTETEQEQYRARFEDDRYGELIFLANPGAVISPNFFDRSPGTVAGMHGYEPNCRADQGLLLVDSTDRAVPEAVGTRPMVDLFPTTLDFLGLPTPETSEGTSILSGESGPMEGRPDP